MTVVLERGGWFAPGDPSGDYAKLACGHLVWVPCDWPEEIDCGECRAEAAGERSAARHDWALERSA